MRHNKTKQMMNYWMELLEQMGSQEDNLDRMVWPERSEINPSTCRANLGDMFILDTDNHQCNYRLAGTRLCEMFGRELKTESFAAAFTDRDESAAENWVGQMSNDNYMTLICADGITETGEVVPLETLIMPLNHMGKRGRRVVGITVALENPYWLGAKPIKEMTIRSVRILRPWEDKVFKTKAHDALPTHDGAINAFGKKTGSFAELTRAAATFDAPSVALQDVNPHPKASHLRVLDGGKV